MFELQQLVPLNLREDFVRTWTVPGELCCSMSNGENRTHKKLKQDRYLSVHIATAKATLHRISLALREPFSDYSSPSKESKGCRRLTVKTSSSPSSASL
jgi:hypothetical protein